MPALHRQIIHQSLLKLRQTTLRRPILASLVALHNSSYHWISFFSSYQGVHPKHAILNYHQFFLDQLSPQDRVADLGCGQGELAFDLAQKVSLVIGFDSKASSISTARSKYQRPNLRFIIADITQLPADVNYDAIILSNVLEHIADRVNFLSHLKLIAPKILIRVPLLTRDWLSVYKKNEGFEYRLDQTHFLEYTEDIFRSEAEAAKLSISHLHLNFGELYAVLQRP